MHFCQCKNEIEFFLCVWDIFLMEFSKMFLGLVQSVFGTLRGAGRRVHNAEMPIRHGEKLAIRNIPISFIGCPVDASRSHNPSTKVHYRGAVVHALLGRHDSRHLCHNHPPWQAVRR